MTTICFLISVLPLVATAIGVGGLLPDFAVNTIDSGLFEYSARRGDQTTAPLIVVVAFDLNNPFDVATLNYGWADFMALSPYPSNVTFVFLSVTPGAAQLARTLAQAAMMSLDPTTRAARLSAMHFSNETVAEMVAHADPRFAVLPTALSTLQNLHRRVTLSSVHQSVTLDRVDGWFQYCNVIDFTNHSPSDPRLPYNVTARSAPGLVPCQPNPSINFAGHMALLDAAVVAATPNCTLEMAAEALVWGNGATQGVLVMAATAAQSPLLPLGLDSFEDQNGLWDGNDAHGFCSTLPRDDSFLASVKDGVPFNVSFQASVGPGWALVVGSRGELAEIGALINPTMSIVGAAAQGLQFQRELQTNLSRPAYVVPLLDTVGVSLTVSAPLPLPPAALAAFNTLEWDATMTCIGTTDLECDMWDHIISVSLDCSVAPGSNEVGGGPHEIGRWITPYRRRVGRWLTPGSSFVPLMSQENCVLGLTTTDNGSPWVFSLSARLTWTEQSSRPFLVVPAFNNTNFSNFGPGYNDRAVLTLIIPPNTRHISLSALITGHGDMEFVPSRHVFTVNGNVSFSVNFMEPLDQYGCAKQAHLGVEPNGHGAWWYGRNGWCNGWAIRPWVVDISEAVQLDATFFTLAYAGFQHNLTSEQWVTPASPGGYIFLSSDVFYA